MNKMFFESSNFYQDCGYKFFVNIFTIFQLQCAYDIQKLNFDKNWNFCWSLNDRLPGPNALSTSVMIKCNCESHLNADSELIVSLFTLVSLVHNFSKTCKSKLKSWPKLGKFNFKSRPRLDMFKKHLSETKLCRNKDLKKQKLAKKWLE